MDPLVKLNMLARQASDFFNDRRNRWKVFSEAALPLEGFTLAMANLLSTVTRALTLADLAERAVIELSVLTEQSQDSEASLPANFIIRLRESLTSLVDGDMGKIVTLIVGNGGDAQGGTMFGVSLSNLLECYTTLKNELHSLLNTTSASDNRPGNIDTTSLVRRLTDLTYLARTLARMILINTERILRNREMGGGTTLPDREQAEDSAHA